MTLFEFFKKDWKDTWIENAIEGREDWFKLDHASNEDMRYIESTLIKKGKSHLAEEVNHLAKVKKAYDWY